MVRLGPDRLFHRERRVVEFVVHREARADRDVVEGVLDQGGVPFTCS